MGAKNTTGSFGCLALEKGLINESQIGEALALQNQYGKEGKRVPRLGEALVSLGYLSADDVRDLLRQQNAMQGEIPTPKNNYEPEPDTVAYGTGESSKETVLYTKDAIKEMLLSSHKTQDENMFGNYKLLERLGTGALGTAWYAQHKTDGQPVVLRVFSDEAMKNKNGFVENFELHVVKITRLEHPGLQKVIRGGLFDDRYYYVCDYIEGKSLRLLLEEEGRLDISFALEITAQIAEALEVGHSKGLMHNYLSPSSIIICPDLTVKLAAYGMMPDPVDNLRLLALDMGRMPYYISPELIIAEGDLDIAQSWSDLYSLGATLYHCLVGLPPFYANSLEDVLPLMHNTENLEVMLKEAELDEGIVNLLMSLLDPDPQRRLHTASELLKALKPLRKKFKFEKGKKGKKPKFKSSRTGSFVSISGGEAGKSSGENDRPKRKSSSSSTGRSKTGTQRSKTGRLSAVHDAENERRGRGSTREGKRNGRRGGGKASTPANSQTILTLTGFAAVAIILVILGIYKMHQSRLEKEKLIRQQEQAAQKALDAKNAEMAAQNMAAAEKKKAEAEKKRLKKREAILKKRAAAKLTREEDAEIIEEEEEVIVEEEPAEDVNAGNDDKDKTNTSKPRRGNNFLRDPDAE